jgi:polysaccharide pyruvyl transferase WcaK-like protein
MPVLQRRAVENFARARARVSRGEYRLVAVAGGPLMSPVFEIFELLGLFTAAEASNTRRAVLGCGVGPVGHSARRDAAIGRLLGLSQHTVLRDSASLELARTHLGFTAHADIAPDPAFIWAAGQASGSASPARTGPILLALREWHAGEYGIGLSTSAAAEMKTRFEAELAAMVDELARLVPEWAVRPIAMHTYARGSDDRLFFERLFRNHPAVLERIMWKRSQPAEDFAAFRMARAVVAMRFHSAVFGAVLQHRRPAAAGG